MKKKAFKKILSVLGNILIAVVLIFAIVITVMAFTSRENGIPTLGGYMFMAVQSDSMETTFYEGDLIIVEKCDPEKLQVGDVVSYWRYTEQNQPYVNTHTIVEVVHTQIEDRTIVTYETRGDNEKENDPTNLAIRYVIGKWTGKTVPKLGAVMDFLKSQVGFLVCVLLPMAIFFIWQLYQFISTMMERKKEKMLAEVEEAKALSEEEKRKIAEEYLASRGEETGEKKKGNDETPPGGEEQNE